MEINAKVFPKPNRFTIWNSWPTSGYMTKRNKMHLLHAVFTDTLFIAAKAETNLGAIMVA